MIDSTIVYTNKTKSSKTITFRYPTIKDAEILKEYINTLSLEKTFITFQGEQVSLEDEKKYLESELDKIKNNKCVCLLAFIENKLVANSHVDLKDKTSAHVGVFGISVAQEFRGEGIGELLMKNILTEAQKLDDLKIIILQVYSPNTIAQSLYKKMGFQEYGRLPEGIKFRGEFVDEISMYKKIK